METLKELAVYRHKLEALIEVAPHYHCYKSMLGMLAPVEAAALRDEAKLNEANAEASRLAAEVSRLAERNLELHCELSEADKPTVLIAGG